jgi:hypothetical protein
MAAMKAVAVLVLQVPVYKLIDRLPGHDAPRCVDTDAVRFSGSRNVGCGSVGGVAWFKPSS